MKSRVTVLKDRWIYLIYILLIVVLFAQKTDFDMDELLTYNLANCEQWFNPETGIKYSPAEQPFLDALTSDGKINLRNVWMQQENDTHPPFYYILVHFICSLFPNTFSMWYAAIINIVFQVLVLWMYRKTLKLFIEEEKILTILSILYIFNSGILSITLFLRMYIMCMFCTMTLTYLILKCYDKFELKDLLAIGSIAVCGTLTHYYFIIYAFFISLLLVVVMVFGKRYQELIKYGGTMLLAEGISYTIFPAMFRHMFLTGRGAQSIEKLTTSNFGEQIIKYYQMIDRIIFGGTLTILLLLIIVFLVVRKKRMRDIGNENIDNSKENSKAVDRQRYIIMAASIICYVITVSKTAPINMDRYVSLVYPVTMICVMTLLYRGLAYLSEKNRVQASLITAIVFMVIICSFLKCEWNYANHDNRERLANAAVYGKGADAVCFYKNHWDLNTAFKEISYCDSVIFYNITTYEEFVREYDMEQLDDDIAMFFVGKKAEIEMFAEDFVQDNVQYEIIHDNGRFNYVHSVYLKKN